MASPSRVKGTDRNLPALGGQSANNDPLDHSERAVVVSTPHNFDTSKARVQAGARPRRIRVVGGGIGRRQS